MNLRLVFASATMLLASATFAGTAAATEIGYVDMQRVLEDSKLGQAAQANLEERFGDQQQAFAREENEIRQLQLSLERDKPLMSKEQIDKKEDEIKERIQKLEQDFAQIQQQLLRAQQEEGSKILDPAREAVISVAKKKKLGAVFEANQAGVVYLDEDGDITEAVIKAMDASSN